jgi:hypothetical protein
MGSLRNLRSSSKHDLPDGVVPPLIIEDKVFLARLKQREHALKNIASWESHRRTLDLSQRNYVYTSLMVFGFVLGTIYGFCFDRQFASFILYGFFSVLEVTLLLVISEAYRSNLSRIEVNEKAISKFKAEL